MREWELDKLIDLLSTGVASGHDLLEKVAVGDVLEQLCQKDFDLMR